MHRLLLATSVMHAFVHQWACQIVNNPRIRTGLGLTDGEGVERLWSRMRKLIAVTRSCGVRVLFIILFAILNKHTIFSILVAFTSLIDKWLQLVLNCAKILALGFDAGSPKVCKLRVPRRSGFCNPVRLMLLFCSLNGSRNVLRSYQ